MKDTSNIQKSEPINIIKENKTNYALVASPPFRIANDRYQQMLKRKEQEKNRQRNLEK